MTEKEAIEIIKNEKRCVLKNIAGCDRKCDTCNLVMDDNKIFDGYGIAIKALEEIQQYRAIGTVDECRAAVEKQKPKKPTEDVYYHKCCPNCGWVVYQDEFGGRYLPHCENCGQAIDWSEEE